MARTTIKPGTPYVEEGGWMPLTTGNPSGGNRENNPPSGGKDSPSGNSGKKSLFKTTDK